MTPEQEQASAKLKEAEENYLRAFGWEACEKGRWKEPREPWRELFLRHAINSQLYYERQSIAEQRARMAWVDKLASYKLNPLTLKEQCDPQARLLFLIRLKFAMRHERRDREAARQEIRSSIRTFARLRHPDGVVTTRVENARRKRAQHALVHKGEGCECGRRRAL